MLDCGSCCRQCYKVIAAVLKIMTCFCGLNIVGNIWDYLSSQLKVVNEGLVVFDV